MEECIWTTVSQVQVCDYFVTFGVEDNGLYLAYLFNRILSTSDDFKGGGVQSDWEEKGLRGVRAPFCLFTQTEERED